MRKQTPKAAGDSKVAMQGQWLPPVVLLLLVLTTFWQAQYNDFLTYDDTAYVVANPNVRDGLTLQGIRGAFADSVASNWQPITILSHQLDVTLFGLNPRGHHVTSVLIHALNTLLLYLFLFRATGDTFKSFFVAALFGVHPLHVESVAWVASRKDVLSTFFLFLALLAYLRYVREQSGKWYAAMAAFFALGLMAKSMLVTFPFLLLLLDYWPSRRIDFSTRDWPARLKKLIIEKVPLFALTAMIAIIALITQRAAGAVQSLTEFSLGARVSNAIISYALYAWRVFWPSPLAVFYPHAKEGLEIWKVVLAFSVLAAITLIVLRNWKSRPYLFVGWCWYLGTLVPVIGLVQIGSQAMADRYTYITIIGIFVMVAWGIGPLLEGSFRKPILALLAGGLALHIALSWSYLRHWRDSESIFRHTISVTRDNFPAQSNLAMALAERGRVEEALPHFEAAVRIEPNAVEGWFNLGTAYSLLAEPAKALPAFEKAVAIAPNDAESHASLADAYFKLGNTEPARKAAARALELAPQHPVAMRIMQSLRE